MRRLLYQLLALLLLSAVAVPAQASDNWLAPPPGWTGEVAAQDAPAAAPASGLRIVVMSPGRRFAVVDGRTLHAGSEFNGAKVVGIQADAVLLSRDGQVEELRSNPAVIKRIHDGKSKADKVDRANRAGKPSNERGEKQ